MVAKFVVLSCLVAAAAAVAVPVHSATYHHAPAPLAYAAPIAKVAYAPAPVQYAAAPVQYAAGPVQYAAAPVQYAAAPITKYIQAEPEAPAHYDFSYSVHDTHTGDIKEQKEARSGDAVQGSYSLVQPDGVHRIVDYTSDKVNGFNAIVRYEGHPTEAPIAKLAYAAPVAKVAYAPAPVHYAQAPIAKLAYPAPAAVAKVAYAPAPVHYAAAPTHYAAAPAHYSAAPAHYAPAAVQYAAAPVAKVAYAAPLGHVSFSSPAISYHH